MRNTMKNNRTFLEKLLDGAEVEWMPLGDVADYEQPTKYLVNSTVYNDNYPTPVLTAGKTFILGYTNEDEGIYFASKSPVIIFDDFTTANKWVDFDFKAKSSAMKMITSKNEKLALLKYIYYWLNTLPNNQTDGDHKRQWISNYANKLIPIPPLSVQTEIVKTLDALTALTSELTSELILRRKQYEYYREKLLSEEELGKVGFEWRTLGDVAKIQRGASPRPISQYITDDPNGIPWIKIGDTSLDSKYIENTAQKITIEGAEKSRILKSGDFVMSNSMSYGRPYILKISGAIHDGWASISDFENILNSDFLYYYLSSNTVQSYWNGKINSSSVSNLNSDIIKSLPIPIPTLNIQIEIAKTLDKFETLTNSITDGLPLAIEQSQKRYEYYRELLLNFS